MTDTPSPRAPNTKRTYSRIDNLFFHHPAILNLTHPERCLYLESILSSSRLLTDGVIHNKQVVKRLCATVDVPLKAVDALVREELWEPTGNGGYRVVNYLDWNPSKAWWDHKRTQDRTRIQRWRDQRRTPTVTEPVTRDVTRYTTQNVHRQELELEENPSQGVAEVHYAGSATTEENATTEPDQQGLTSSDRGVYDGAVAMAGSPTRGSSADDAVGGISGELEQLMARLKPQGA